VRLLAVECCGPLAKLSSKEGVVTHILPVVQKFSQVPGDASTPCWGWSLLLARLLHCATTPFRLLSLLQLKHWV